MSINADINQLRADLEATTSNAVTISRAEIIDLLDRVERGEQFIAEFKAWAAQHPANG